MEFEELVDLRTLLAHGRLVERELDPMIAAAHHLAHERGVLGGDIVADELGHVHETHDPVVEADPFVHPAQFDVAHHVIESLEQVVRHIVPSAVGGRLHHVAGQIRAGVARAVDERVPRLPVRRDGCEPHRAVLVGDVVRLVEYRCAAPARVIDALLDVGYLQRDVDDPPVTVQPVTFGDRAVRIDRTLDDESYCATGEYIRVPVTVAVVGPEYATRFMPYADCR